MPSDVGVCLFAKAPRPGQAKTRLRAALGQKGASQLARALLLDALEVWSRTHLRLMVFESGTMDPELEIELDKHERFPQEGEDLGARMESALRLALQKSEIAVVVGSDIPGLGREDIQRTKVLLETHDAVLGPTVDGGFSLVALRRCPKGLLADISWSCDTTRRHTQSRLEEAGMRVALLPTRFDVDVPGDLPVLAAYLRKNPDSMPCTQAFLSSPDNLSISVIVPVLNEEARLPMLLQRLETHKGLSEIVVVDGGSEDDTIAIAQASESVQLVRSAPGRAMQMNRGAELASGGILLFLHADVELPSDAQAQIHSAMSESESLAGAFRLRTCYDEGGRSRPWIRPFLKLADMRSRYSGLPYGDQAIFVRSQTFRLLGGFPALPLFEDLALSTALRRLRPLVIADGPVLVSGRRFQERPFYYLALMNSFPLLYRLGVSPERLAHFYHHTR